MIVVTRTIPWYRDRGLIAGLALCLFVLVFNVLQRSPGQQITGTLAAAPILTAVLTARAARVLICTAAASLIAIAALSFNQSQDGESVEWLRVTLIVLCGLAGYAAARIRLREQAQLVGMREVARSAQRAIMTPSAPAVHGLDAAVRYASATRYAYIGGDAYESADTDYGLRLLVADARGKGLGAIRTSAVAIGAFREWAHAEPDLCQILMRMDQSITRETGPENFVTALIAEIELTDLRYCAAGHPPPLLLRSGCVGALPLKPSPPLSMVNEYGPPTLETMVLEPEDVVLLYTDGLTEARNHAGMFFPVEDVVVRINEPNKPIDQIADDLISELREFVDSELNDDVAFVMLRPH